MGKVVILSGVSGSGKSTTARKLWNELEPGTYCRVVSADDFFMVEGVYKFDPTKLSEAHGKCFRDFIAELQPNAVGKYNHDLVVVDNTNTTSEEIAPYILGAQAFGWEVEILTSLPHPTTNWADYYAMCAARNAHGVGFDTIKAQHKRIVNRSLPPWWKNTHLYTEV